MPIETRSLMFDREELIHAAEGYLTVENTIPVGHIVRGIEVRPEVEGNVLVTVAADCGKDYPVELTYGQMTAALVHFCRQHRVPMPRHSNKRLIPIGEAATLSIRMGYARSPSGALPYRTPLGGSTTLPLMTVCPRHT